MLLRCGKYQLFKGEKSVCLENMSINITGGKDWYTYGIENLRTWKASNVSNKFVDLGE